MSAATYKFLRLGPGEQMGWALAVSAGLHIVLVGVILFGKLMMPNKREFFSPVYQVQLVGASALQPAAAPPAPAPKPTPPAPKPEAKPEPKPEPKPEVKPKPEPKPEVAKEAIALKKPDKPEEKPKPKPPEKPPEVDSSQELAKRMENLQARVSEQRQLENALRRLQTQVASRGNTVAGAFAGAAGPAGGAQTSMRDQIYLNELWERIQRNWVLSEVLVSKPRGLVAVVMVRIRKDGSLEKAWLEQGSGNARYDESALRAAEKAAPFPPPPAGGSGAYEVGVRFRVEDMG